MSIAVKLQKFSFINYHKSYVTFKVKEYRNLKFGNGNAKSNDCLDQSVLNVDRGNPERSVIELVVHS